ncbi:hypothetical protein CK556_01185 [Mesoplasma chauliocola]|uniref:Uncharacterized protein n=1 Tax=Mesoplasma chauliocola TaxID=216427 RepID=A0A249SMX9_9MOLU|nr:hypothetical protein [Mesoplasma chauliocola]ASZ08970.1 hypothetical protein CK556_01185 [Mesoplasma chauliocola]
MSTDKLLGLIIMIIGIILMVIFGVLAFWVKNRSKMHDEFYRVNKESQTIWEFTKKNFPIFMALFGFVMAFSGLMMLL